ncbi:membrane protein [Nocardioides marinquilinus]|uniref:Membrane protein n=1 Tax=Nocardioides marinquilinus TaxID=1210400 RepID=A0ABP9P7U5_9ACTN
MRTARAVARVLLGAFLLFAGVAHLVVLDEFLGQVPTFLPWREAIVVVSGLVELVLGAALLAVPLVAPHRLRALGWVVAAFFVAVFPGNVWQAVNDSTSFGLDTDAGRVVRLFFQPLLVVWALWCTRQPDRER